MGCLVSKTDGSPSGGDKADSGSLAQQGHAENRFPVRNLDSQDRVVGEGELEITETDLVLHAPGAEPIRWPLQFLRRYGFDESMFSFESGRRCPTGEGIYAFSTRHAKAIFTLVQHNVQYGPKTVPGVEGLHNGGCGSANAAHHPPSSRGDNGPSPLTAPHIVKVQESKKIEYTKIETGGGGGALSLPPPKPVPPTVYSKVITLSTLDPQQQPGSAGNDDHADGVRDQTMLNYIQIEKVSGVLSTPPPKPPSPTVYRKVISLTRAEF